MGPDRRAAHSALLGRRLGRVELLDLARATPADRIDEPQLAILELAHELTLADLERDERLAIRAREWRWVRLGVLVCVGAALAVGAGPLWARWRAPADLARNKPWTTSSIHVRCDPAEGLCGQERMRALFFTNEEPSPWFRIDLGGPTTFSSLTVVNRSDMLRERAVPLVVEASDDLEHWRELGRQGVVFNQWEPSFAPVTARYVRLRADRFTALHLEQVEVHP
jgi:hypothetical protein